MVEDTKDNEVGLYFHIPFCTEKCAYCHFYVLPDKEPYKIQLVEGLKKEWMLRLPLLEGKKISTIYFGGGTPSLLGACFIGQILSWVRSLPSSPSPEITLECNPESISADLIAAYADVGINRISIGIQTLDDTLLPILTRTHSAQKAIDSIHAVIAGGITNISVDLMYDLPGQTIRSWHETLQQTAELPIKHLSLYNLTIEPHTPFFRKKEVIASLQPHAETSRAMYEMALMLLERQGLKPYEISAFCHPGYFSRHNVGYWIGRPFLGFGPSAFSYWESKRFRNIANLSRYSKALEENRNPVDFEEHLSLEAQKRELLVVQLRLLSGVNLIKFQQKHGPLDSETKSILQILEKEGLLKTGGEHISLTRRGILLYDTIAAELV